MSISRQFDSEDKDGELIAADLDSVAIGAPSTKARDGMGGGVPPRRSGGASTSPAPPTGNRRTGPRQFLHEVNVEMRKVAWPTRETTINYSIVVLVTLSVLMALIFGLDLGFSKLALFLFK